MTKSDLTKNFLRTLFGENLGFIEFRVLKAIEGKTSMVKQLFCESVDHDVFDTTLNKLSKVNYYDDSGIFFGVLPRASQSGRQESIKHITTLWADLDGKYYEGGKSEALGTLVNFQENPSIIVDSGHGYHAYWILKKAVPIENPTLIRGILRGIRKSLGVDSVLDLSGILRLPGTFNLKNGNKPVECEIIERTFNPELRYTLADFSYYYDEPGHETVHAAIRPIPNEA